MSVNSIGEIGSDSYGDKFKKSKLYQEDNNNGIGTFSAAVNMFKNNPTLIGNILNGGTNASSQL